jgi:NAD+ kinase
MPLDLDHRSNFLAVGDRKVYDFVMRSDVLPQEGLRYGVYTNASVPKAAEYTRQVLDALKGHEVSVDVDIAKVLGIPGVPLQEMDADLVIVIGGDGTLLRAMQGTDAPVIGINGGSVGFLAEIDKDRIDEGIARLLAGDYSVDTRFKIATWYDGEYLPDSVNEAVVHTDTGAKIRHYRIYVDDVLAADFRADGIVVSTPTGSTCYAMSLGAPYMDPNVNAILIVPMAPYKYTSRPFVVPATSKVTVENVMDKGCMLVLDGQSETQMRGGTTVQFMMSSKKARLIRFKRDFYSRVREKLVNGE